MDSFDKSFNFVKIIIGFVIFLMIGTIIFKVGLISNTKKNNKPLYEIEVNSFNHVETYITTDYVKEPTTGCIKFKDEFGIKRIVCNNYTITEY